MQKASQRTRKAKTSERRTLLGGQRGSRRSGEQPFCALFCVTGTSYAATGACLFLRYNMQHGAGAGRRTAPNPVCFYARHACYELSRTRAPRSARRGMHLSTHWAHGQGAHGPERVSDCVTPKLCWLNPRIKKCLLKKFRDSYENFGLFFVHGEANTTFVWLASFTRRASSFKLQASSLNRLHGK